MCAKQAGHELEIGVSSEGAMQIIVHCPFSKREESQLFLPDQVEAILRQVLEARSRTGN